MKLRSTIFFYNEGNLVWPDRIRTRIPNMSFLCEFDKYLRSDMLLTNCEIGRDVLGQVASLQKWLGVIFNHILLDITSILLKIASCRLEQYVYCYNRSFIILLIYNTDSIIKLYGELLMIK